MSTRRALKRLAESGLLRSGAATLSLHARRGQSLILAYHDIVPDGAVPVGDVSLHLSQAHFAAQLDALARTHDVMPLHAILGNSQTGGSRPRVAITFDDAYHGAVTVGVAELERRAMSATIFVPPGLLGGREFWWDALSPASTGTLDPAVRRRSLGELAGKGDLILEDARRTDRPLRVLPLSARSATEEELCRAAAVKGVTLGSHTWSHPNLSALGAAELDDELRRPLTWLRERFEGVTPYLTYPYGLYSLTVQNAARSAGYAAALCIDGGWVRSSTQDPFAIPRLDVPSGISQDGFCLRVAGLTS